MALLGKQSWHIITHPKCLMVRLLKAKYFLDYSYLDDVIKPDANFIAKSIFESRGVLKLGLVKQIGDRSDTKIWCDPRLPTQQNPHDETLIPAGSDDTFVADLLITGERRWNESLVEQIFNERDASFILSIPFSLRNVHDY